MATKKNKDDVQKDPKKRPKADVAKERPEELPHARERAQFRALLMANPNYFGNLQESPFTPVLNIQANTTYESLGCVGFQPDFDRLEAVVYIHQPFGYGGDICSPGTPEYVRFFMSTDNGATWDCLGLTSFTAYNIPEGTQGPKRLEYAVTLQIDPKKKFCFTENLAQVRAILSWNVPPPCDPDFVPVWGDVHDTHIQLEPTYFFPIIEALEAVEIEPVPQLAEIVDLAEPVKAPEPKALTVVELNELYRDKGVESHRFALAELQRFMSQPTFNETLMASDSQGLLPELGIDWSEIGDLLNPTDGSTRYEELECIGLNSNLDTLVGVIRVKRPYGYDGPLCTAGSQEYVTFWADFNNNGTFETCLGTTSVNVHDITSIPKEGLEYAVFLPVDLSKHRQPCQQGPVVVRIRAILSWQVVPDCFNPNYVPVWGNRLETLIHIKAGTPPPSGTHYPIIQTVGGMDNDDIDPLTGLANGVPVGFASLDPVQDSPFGGVVIITGHIGNAPDFSSGATKLKYRVEVSDNGGLTWQRVTNSFALKLDQLLNSIWSPLPDITQSVDADDWYEYQEDLTDGPGNAMIFPAENVLARWNTSGLSGVWKLRIRAKDPAAPGPEWTSNVVTIKLDNKAPEATITIKSGKCNDFTISDTIEGTYSATDLHFGSLRLSVAPALGGSFTSPAPLPTSSTTMPLIRTYAGGVPTTGETGKWLLDTSGMPKCGYVVRLHVWDRTIRDSGFIGHQASDVVGLCLREPSS